jgi:hypothetical protein
VAEGWRKHHNEELHNLYTSSNIIRVIKSRRMRWAKDVARMGIWKTRTIFSIEKLKGRDQLEDLGVDGKIILEWILG